MSPAEIDAFLRAPRIADLATVRPDGSPHVAPVWYHYDGTKVKVIAARTAVKIRNVRNDPRVSLSIATDSEPYEYVTISGTATISDDDVADLVRTMAAHYMGPEEGSRYSEKVLEEADFCTITVTPSKISGWGDQA